MARSMDFSKIKALISSVVKAQLIWAFVLAFSHDTAQIVFDDDIRMIKKFIIEKIMLWVLIRITSARQFLWVPHRVWFHTCMSGIYFLWRPPPLYLIQEEKVVSNWERMGTECW